MTKETIKVLIVDDSIVPREMLTQILTSDPSIEVAGTAKDGEEAVEMAKRLSPDLITMDIHMPRMDGLKATEQIMAYNPTPILVVSSSVHGEGLGRAFDALDAGALEVMKKPEPRDWQELQSVGQSLIRKVKLLANVRVITHVAGKAAQRKAEQPVAAAPSAVGRRELVAIGSSTGGPSALLNVLGTLPADFPVPVAVAQHIAEGFVPGLVGWLDAGCKISVVVADDDEELRPGHAYFAPTGTNLEIRRGRAVVTDARPGQLYIPSADTLFLSVAERYGADAVGVLLTGMGSDGAEGLRTMREAGAATVAQDETTSTVFGMPKAAIELGAASVVLPIHAVGGELMRLTAAGARD
jgi:two-component system chemotaxis response regulator CheB